ncbi:Cupin 2, conserved barrel domain protein [Seminavis robusta]|uniref:Cupin 2, conserved barrel domain protein n=1 Tax=Seminavis robusta TaxID=568900 RepID=A0A9N8DLE9_9STRA|nr:Cupin 2, conserved barrel domain protein [Seminavis robusta]|eukprot:Sro189_g081430.1 Cupin 2, conserved barrel domain protein (228) ;mRNA; r:24503-25186
MRFPTSTIARNPRRWIPSTGVIAPARRQMPQTAAIGAKATFTSTVAKSEQDTPFLARWKEDTVFASQKEPRPKVFIEHPGPRSLQLLVEPSDTAERMCLYEERVPPGAGTPVHVHFTEDEYFTFLEGQFKVIAGPSVLDVKAGETIFVPRGTPHAWCNVSDGPGRLLFGFTPCHKGHKLMEDVLNPDFRETNTPETMKDVYDIAILTEHFISPDSEELKTGWTKGFP